MSRTTAPIEAGAVGRRQGTVMVVEDEPAVRDMTTRLLERAGYTVIAVPDGVAALTTSQTATTSTSSSPTWSCRACPASSWRNG